MNIHQTLCAVKRDLAERCVCVAVIATALAAAWFLASIMFVGAFA